MTLNGTVNQMFEYVQEYFNNKSVKFEILLVFCIDITEV